MTSQRISWFIYGGVAVGIVALTILAPASPETSWRVEFALRMLVMTAGIVLAIRGLFRRDIPCLLVGTGLVIATYDMSKRWLGWLGMTLSLAGFCWMAYQHKFDAQKHIEI